MTAGVAAGHPATAQTGLSILEAGGSAADAAVAAVLASCVAETILTGIGGGGFATHFNAATGEVTCLDFFCAIPGLGRPGPASPMCPIDISFGGVPQRFSIGPSSIAVPGTAAGLGELHRRWGRLPWADLVAPAIELAERGVPLPEAHATALSSVAPAMTHGPGEAVYAPGGRLLASGDLLFHPGLGASLRLLAELGPQAFYHGPIGQAIVRAVRDAGGTLTQADLAAYRVRQLPVASASIAGHEVFGRQDLNQTVATVGALPSALARQPARERTVALARALVAPARKGYGCTTNTAVVDREGDACVVTTSLGIGSGVWVPATGIHLNSMLGEGELWLPGLGPGERMASNMCPLIVVDAARRLTLATGSAGASRIRTALLHTLVNVLIDGDDLTSALARPRFHPVAERPFEPAVAHAEPRYPETELTALESAGYRVVRWDHFDHYFGGVSAVGTGGAAGDPRRGGVGLLA